jgi:nucleotide-binding universal stress UspA family protein
MDMQKGDMGMQRHFLVTLSAREDGLFGIRFIGNFFTSKEGMKVTLLYTTPRAPSPWDPDMNADSQARKAATEGRQTIDRAREHLVKHGFDPDQVITKLQERRVSKIMEIIHEGVKGLYDAVILGRRGLSWLEHAFDESVTKGLLEQAFDFPIWVCRRPDLERRNVLACVDGSPASHRMVDHVAHILDQEKQQTVTFLAVGKKGRIDGKNTERILEDSREILVSRGFPSGSIRLKQIEEGSISKVILKEADEGGFAAVAVGRTGTGQGLLKKIFVGSVSQALFQELQGAALWLA